MKKTIIAVLTLCAVATLWLAAQRTTAGAVLFAGLNGSPDGDPSNFSYVRSTHTLTVGTVVAAITGNITGNVTGNVTGNLSGNVSGSFPGEFRAFCTGTVGSAETDFLNGGACSGATTATATYVVSTAGTIGNLRVNMATAVKSSASGVAMLVNKNGSPTTITCTVATAAKTCSDTTHTVAVAAGDIISFAFGATNSTDTAANVGAGLQKY